MTNREWINSMNNEEFADFIIKKAAMAEMCGGGLPGFIEWLGQQRDICVGNEKTMNYNDFETFKEEVQKTMKTLETIKKKKCIAVIGIECATDLLQSFLGVQVVISTTMFSGENIYIMGADEIGH